MGVVPDCASPIERTRNRIAACDVRASLAGRKSQRFNAEGAEERLAEVAEQFRVALEQIAPGLAIMALERNGQVVLRRAMALGHEPGRFFSLKPRLEKPPVASRAEASPKVPGALRPARSCR